VARTLLGEEAFAATCWIAARAEEIGIRVDWIMARCMTMVGKEIRMKDEVASSMIYR
jgi:hypothetical protein